MENSNMNDITQNDIKIMSCIYDVKTKIGLSKSKGITINQLVNKVNQLSESKVRKTIRTLIDCGYVDYGIKNGKQKTYHITADGIHYIQSLKSLSINLTDGEEV